MSTGDPAALASAIIQSAVNGIGHCYQFGGAPGRNSQGCWDCSSFANDVIGHQNNLAIPGYQPGAYDGTNHGPSTLGWLEWQGIGVGSVDRSAAQAADLATWRTHMGICLNNAEMVSAENPAAGTQRSQIDGFIPGEQLIILRLAVIGSGGITIPIPVIGGTAALERLTRTAAQDIRHAVALRGQVRRIGTRRQMPWN